MQDKPPEDPLSNREGEWGRVAIAPMRKLMTAQTSTVAVKTPLNGMPVPADERIAGSPRRCSHGEERSDPGAGHRHFVGACRRQIVGKEDVRCRKQTTRDDVVRGIVGRREIPPLAWSRFRSRRHARDVVWRSPSMIETFTERCVGDRQDRRRGRWPFVWSVRQRLLPQLRRAVAQVSGAHVPGRLSALATGRRGRAVALGVRF
jgi:hypothetical protein